MIKTVRQRHEERPPNKIAGYLYVWIGIVALALAAFVVLAEGKLGPISNFKIGLGVVIALWGLFRIYTGIMTVRKASQASKMVTLPDESTQSKPTL